MTASPLLRIGDRGEAVRDVQQRLIAAGLGVNVDGSYDDGTEQAVRAFQTRRRIRVDGICGPETWAALIESGFALGDRLLYLCQPMLRGDDVVELQRRLNALGFDAGREDGILGPETEAAVGTFQRDAGLATDKVAGPATLDALGRVGSLAGGSVANVRERELLRRQSRTLEGLRIYIASDLGISALSTAVAQGLRRRGALVGLDTSETDPTFIAATANKFQAEAFVALSIGAEPGARCAYFANQTFRSEGGYCLATRLTDSLRLVMPVEVPIGRTYRLLRETRMAAVVCEVVGHGDVDALATLTTTQLPVATAALVDGIRRGVEDPVDAAR